MSRKSNTSLSHGCDGTAKQYRRRIGNGNRHPACADFRGVADLARYCAGACAIWPGSGAIFRRPVAPADIHLTLVPPWNEVSPAEAVEKLRRVVDRFCPFTLTFRHVGYGPEPKRPRFLWAECVASKEIAEFRVALIQAFGQADERPFRPHVTLARLRDKGRALARKHPLDQDLALTQRIESIELMQSPPPDGSGYKILASVPLAVSL